MNEMVDSEIGKVAKDWKIDTLKNHLIIKGRIGWKGLKTSEYTEDGPYIVGGLQFDYDRVNWNKCAHITNERYDESPEIMLKENDILITKDGTIGKLAFIEKLNFKATVASHIHVVREKSDIVYPKFLFYFFKSPVFKHLVKTKESGSVIPALTQEDINSIHFPIPKVEEQKLISNILWNLDQKILLLRQQNGDLENLAQTLFKRWFVDFEFPNSSGEPYKSTGGKMIASELGEIPEGWSCKELQELVEVKRGGSPRPIKDFIVEDGLPWVKISDATATSSPFLMKTKEFIKEEGLSKTVYLKKGSLILSNSATPGLPKFLELDACIHDGWLHFPKVTVITQNYMYLLFLQLKSHIIKQGSGSVFTNLKTDILKEQKIPVATDNVIQSFDCLIDSYFNKIRNNTYEIQTLTNLRDTLLPKLMSGELRVK